MLGEASPLRSDITRGGEIISWYLFPFHVYALYRRSSIAAIPRPSTPVQARTPSARHTSISIPPSSVGTPSARRRSGIPTPSKFGGTVTRPDSRLSLNPARYLLSLSLSKFMRPVLVCLSFSFFKQLKNESLFFRDVRVHILI